MNHFYSVLFPTVCAEYSQFQSDWHSTNDPCPLPIYHVCSFCVQKCHKSQPWWIHAAQTPQQNCKGFMGNPIRYLGGWMISPTYPHLPQWSIPHWGKPFLVITSTSHQWHRWWIIPVNPCPRCVEAIFVYIDLQHMWHSCCRQRLVLAEVCSCFPLAMVQLAGKRASSTHLTNQYKQWGSKSRSMLEGTEMGERIKLLIICCLEIILFWDLVKHVFMIFKACLCYSFSLCISGYNQCLFEKAFSYHIYDHCIIPYL